MSSQPFDHTSVLRFLETLTGVREPNISEWRRKTFSDLGAVLRFGAPAAKPPLLSDTSGPLVVARYGVNTLPKPAFPEGDQRPPQQEKGSRQRI